MANLKTDSPLSRRIVRAFFDFLDSVEGAPGVDLEGLDVAKECLNEVFKLDSTSSSNDDPIRPCMLIDLFRSLEGNLDQNVKSDFAAAAAPPVNAPSFPHSHTTADVDVGHSQASGTQGDNLMELPIGESKDEHLGQFFSALEKIHFFKTMADGNDDPVQLDKATRIFHDALNEMENAGCQSFNWNSLAETLKSQGNRAMQSKAYSEAIELYSCAISVCENNAVYYCNRAAAYTQVQKYTEAIRDCLKSIEIDPHYSKAYSRLGLAYYAQGNYRDAIDKGFSKALQLDPQNESVKENIRVAEQKLKEEQQRRTGWDQMDSSGQENQEPPFTSMPFNINGIPVPVDFTNMLQNMAARFSGEHPQERQGEHGNVDGPEEPEIRLGGNINLNLAENMPEEIRGALRSMMGLFSGAAPQPEDTNTTNGRSRAN